MDTGPMKDNIFGSEAFVYFWQKWKCITDATNFKISFKIWHLMHMTAYTGKVPWPSSATARGLGGGQRRSQVSLAGGLTEFQGGINLNTYSYGKRDSAA